MLDNIMNILFGKNNNGRNNRIFNFSPRSRYRNNRLVYQLIAFEQAKTMIEQNQVTLIDVRTQNEYDLMHIRGAINIPVADIEKKIFIYEQNAPLMLYCSSGVRSKTAIEILNNLGYGNIYIWEYGALATFPYKGMLEYNSN